METETKEMSRAMRCYYKKRNDPERWEAFLKQRREKYQSSQEWRNKAANRHKTYRKTGKGIYNKRMNSWINYQQMKSHNWDETYERYDKATECELCGVLYDNQKKNGKILDHDHHSGYVRNVCCCKCNNTLGVVDRLKNVLHLELHRYFLRK